MAFIRATLALVALIMAANATTGHTQETTTMSLSSNSSSSSADAGDMTDVSSMNAMNATAAVYDDLSDVVQAAMNATAFLFNNHELQSFMSAQDGMDWLWRPSLSARWCKEACVATNKTMCPSGQLDQPMQRTDSCRTCVLECLACTYEDNYWMTLRSYIMSLMAPLIQLASATMAVDMSDLNQATQAQQAQQNMYEKFNAAVSPMSNRMMLDRMFGLNCQVSAGYQGLAQDATPAAGGASSADAMTNSGNSSGLAAASTATTTHP